MYDETLEETEGLPRIQPAASSLYQGVDPRPYTLPKVCVIAARIFWA